MEILEIEPDIQDTKNAVVLQHVEGNVMFDHVSFRCFVKTRNQRTNRCFTNS